MTSVKPIADFGKSGKKIFPRNSGGRQDRAYLLAQTLKTPLLRHQNEAVPKAKHSERRAIPQPKIFPELLWNGNLAFFANPGRRQIFESWIVACHIGRKILPYRSRAA